MAKAIHLEFDGEAMALMEELGEYLNAKSPARTLRKVLALAKIAVDAAKDSEGVVVLRGKGAASEVNVDLRN